MTSPLASLRARVDAEKARRSDSGIPFCPHKPTPPQAAFLALTEPEAFYGGAAGGGKSDCLLMDHLQWVNRPLYSGLILRRTLPDLALPGAIMDRAKAWLIPQGVSWNEQAKLFRFPSGARLQFGFCETANDVFRYQGAEFHRISIDELTQWDEAPYQYLQSRIRRGARDDIPLAMRGAGNPGGRGHKWVKRHFVSPGHPSRPFVPAKIDDNPHLDRALYTETLARLDDVTRAQLRDGVWIDDRTGRIYAFDRMRNCVTVLPDFTGWHTVLAVDLGASELTPTTAFAFVRWHPIFPTAYCVKAWKEAGMSPTTCGERLLEAMEIFPGCQVTMDEGALGQGYGREMRTRFQIPVVPATKTDKLGAIRLMNGALEGPLLPDKTHGPPELMIDATECAGLVDELEGLIWHPSGLRHDPSTPNHESDALLYGWRMAQSWASRYHKPEPKLSEEERLEKLARSRYDARRSNPDADW